MLQGEVYWLEFDGRGSEPRGRRPAIVVQDDCLNASAIQTTIVAAITSNLRLADAPGNVRLRRGEAGLPQPSVINVTQLRTVDRGRLRHRVGVIGRERRNALRRGLALALGTDRLEGE